MRSRVVAIVGAKGSPGCSFLAVALARCLAASNISTLLLDADGEGGGLAALLDLGTVGPVGASDDMATDVPMVQIDKCLWFVELLHGDSQPFNGLQLAGAARKKHAAVVVDLGHSAGSLQRQLSAASDWLLWVVVPDRSGLERADKALASSVLGAASVGLIFNRIRPGCLERADEVLSSRHGMPVMARITENHRVADRLSQGRPVHHERGLGLPLRELARSVHPDAGSPARAWP